MTFLGIHVSGNSNEETAAYDFAVGLHQSLLPPGCLNLFCHAGDGIISLIRTFWHCFEIRYLLELDLIDHACKLELTY